MKQSKKPLALKNYNYIKTRCYNKNRGDYKYYGGRGIKMCDRWLNSFENFYKDMGERPSLLHTIDRIDNNGDYTPENCKWATRKEQSNNSRQVRLMSYDNQSYSMRDWAIKKGMSVYTLSSRLNQLKWSVEKTLSTPQIKRKKEDCYFGIPKGEKEKKRQAGLINTTTFVDYVEKEKL